MPRQAGKDLKTLKYFLNSDGYTINRLAKWNHYEICELGKSNAETKVTDFVGDNNFADIYDWFMSQLTAADAIRNINTKYPKISVASSTVRIVGGTTKTRRSKEVVIPREPPSGPTINNFIDASKLESNNVEDAQEPTYAASVLKLKTREDTPAILEKPIDFTTLAKMPNVYENYYFPDFKNHVITRIIKNRPIYLSGPAGSGKSDMIAKMAKFAGVNFIRINFYVGITESQLVGKFTVKDSQTKFVYGYLPLAMKHGWWVLLDEIDYAQPENLAILQPILEGNPLVVVQNEGEVINPHPNFRVFSTGNTKGRGDESNSYSGTNFLNASFMDRFSVFEMEYTSKEIDIVQSIVGDADLSEKIMQMFKLFRKASDGGDVINSTFSTRRLIQFSEALRDGDYLIDALKYEVLSRYNSYESNTLYEIAADVFDRDHYFKKWKLGMPHHSAKTIETPVVPESEIEGL